MTDPINRIVEALGVSLNVNDGTVNFQNTAQVHNYVHTQLGGLSAPSPAALPGRRSEDGNPPIYGGAVVSRMIGSAEISETVIGISGSRMRSSMT